MSKYETYKPSGIEWVGELPEHWRIMRLKDIANVTLGKMLQNDDSGSDDLKPYLRSFNVQWDRVDLSEVKEMWLSEYEQEQYRLNKFDLVVSEGGEVGRCTIWLNELEECYIQNSVHKVTCNKRILSYFLLYQFTTAGKAGFFEKIVNKVSIGHLTREKLVSVNFVLPPIAEQLTIANYLEHQTQKIDRLIANKKAQAEKLKELRQIEINNAVTKGLNPNAEMKDSGIDWLGKIPKHWEMKRVKGICKIVNGSTPSSSIERYWDGDIVWVTPGDYKNFAHTIGDSDNKITDEGYKNCGTTLVPIGSIILTTRAPIGNVLIASKELCTNQGCKSLVPFRVDSEFLYFYFSVSSIQLNALGQGTTFIELSTGHLSTFKVLVPPKEEQILIAKYLQERTATIDKLIVNIDAQIEKLQELRKIKIYEAVTGKIEVSGYEQGN